MFNSHRTAQGVRRFYTRRYLCTRTILTCIISYVYTCTIAFICKWTFINPRTFILVHNSFSTCHPGRHANAEQLGRHQCLCRTILWNHLSEKTCPMLNCRKIYATPTRLPHQSDNQRSKLQADKAEVDARMQRMEKTMADIIDNFASISQVSRDAGDRHRQRAGDRHRQRHRSTSRGQCTNRSSDDHSRACARAGPPLPPPRVRARIRTQPTWKRRTTRRRGQRPDSPHHTDSSDDTSEDMDTTPSPRRLTSKAQARAEARGGV